MKLTFLIEGVVFGSSRVSGSVLGLVWVVMGAEDLRSCHRRYLLVRDRLPD